MKIKSNLDVVFKSRKKEGENGWLEVHSREESGVDCFRKVDKKIQGLTRPLKARESGRRAKTRT